MGQIKNIKLHIVTDIKDISVRKLNLIKKKFTMEVFLMIKRDKTAIFLDFKEATSVSELKKVLEGIVKKSPDDIRLIYNKNILEDTKTLADCGLSKAQTKAQTPAELGMAFRNIDGEFEELNIVPVSTPPELPVQMKQQELPAAGS